MATMRRALSSSRAAAPAAPAAPRVARRVVRVRAEAPEAPVKERKEQQQAKKGILGELSGLGDALGPIGLTYSGGVKPKEHDSLDKEEAATARGADGEPSTSSGPRSIARITTEEWRERYERDGTVDLFVEEEFNAGSRLVGGRAVHWGGTAGFRSGEGPTAGDAPRHTVTIRNPFGGEAGGEGETFVVEVPEDRYILWEAEDAGLELPYACRMGCCTACAVRVVSGELRQVEALGVSQGLRDAGYGLMCVAYPVGDCELELVEEDEVYMLQFGRAFEEMALDPNTDSVQRDDFAIELALGDE